MQLSPSGRRLLLVLSGIAAVGLIAGIGFVLFRLLTHLPQPGSPRYEEYVEAFELGTAALDSSLPPLAAEKLTLAIEKIPQEPAAWANRALLHLRNGETRKAAADLERARQLASDRPEIEELLGHLAEREGKLDEATRHFENASRADPDDLRRLYKLVEMSEKQGASGDEQRQLLLEKILARRPTSLPVLTQRLQVALRRGDRPAVEDTFERLTRLAPGWGEEPGRNPREQFALVRAEAKGALDAPDLILRVRQLDNVLKAELGYPRSAEELKPPDVQVGSSLQQFLRLAPMKTDPSPPDREMKLVERTLPWAPEVLKSRWDVILPVWLEGTGGPVVVVANAREVRRASPGGPTFPFPSGEQKVAPTSEGVLAIDWNNDHATDFLLAGAGGLRFHQQDAKGNFEDVTRATKLPSEVLNGDYFGAWAADLDQDGDLDIILAPRQGPLLTLRNNSDGTYLAQRPLGNVQAARCFGWADLDNDGAPDAILLDAQGRLAVFMNERSGQFRQRTLPDSLPRGVAAMAADVDDDGVLDIVLLTSEGPVVRISDREKGTSWEVAELARVETKEERSPGNARLQAIDLDNNGAADLVLRTPMNVAVWLADGKKAFAPLALPAEVATQVRGMAPIASLEENGKLDFLSLSPEGKPGCHTTDGTKGYHWLVLKCRNEPKGTGAQRINSYAIGSEFELRARGLIVKLLIEQPALHVGLGDRANATLFRLVWTNGALQYEFEKPTDAVIQIAQRLKGSCPFLFTWDGEKMAFVTDFCWSTPLGLFINAQKRGGGFAETTEWLRVGGNQLVPRDGYYDVRVNANLWETHYLDQLALMVVDHPPGTELFCDERFFLEPTKPRYYLTSPLRPVARAWDHHGKDVTDLVVAADGRYLDRAGRGNDRGVTHDHWVEVDLGEIPPGTDPVYLLAQGWLNPTDSSINFARQQGEHEPLRPLSLEIPDGKGGWQVARPALGFPAGKNKTLVLRLDDLPGKGHLGKGLPRSLRLRTNMEIYWDRLAVARGLDPAPCRATTLAPRSADLRFRGILRMREADRSSPSLPDYDAVEATGQVWRDLIGYHTRFGEVKELVEKVDDRYVLLNSGDEIRMRFDVPPAPPEGWKRDFVWISDGWTKDGDLNTGWGKTVLPLPWHGMTNYDRPPGRLEDDPVYQRHQKDWQTYHTRYITPAAFEKGLRAHRRPR